MQENWREELKEKMITTLPDCDLDLIDILLSQSYQQGRMEAVEEVEKHIKKIQGESWAIEHYEEGLENLVKIINTLKLN